MIAWSALTDLDFGPWTSYAVPFCRQAFSIWICMASIESTLIRFLTKFVWKRMAPINHEFTVLFLNFFNMTFSCLLPIITGVSGSFQELFRLQGKSSYLRPKPIFNPKYSVSNLVVPLQLNWEKNLKNIVKDSEAIFPSFLAHYTPNESPTILEC